jgi:hypothetical protein
MDGGRQTLWKNTRRYPTFFARSNIPGRSTTTGLVQVYDGPRQRAYGILSADDGVSLVHACDPRRALMSIDATLKDWRPHRSRLLFVS